MYTTTIYEQPWMTMLLGLNVIRVWAGIMQRPHWNCSDYYAYYCKYITIFGGFNMLINSLIGSLAPRKCNPGTEFTYCV